MAHWACRVRVRVKVRVRVRLRVRVRVRVRRNWACILASRRARSATRCISRAAGVRDGLSLASRASV